MCIKFMRSVNDQVFLHSSFGLNPDLASSVANWKY